MSQAEKLPPHDPSGLVLRTVEMHAGGEPLRVVPPWGGLAPLATPGLSLLERRRLLLTSPELDAARRLLMHEPRGHRDMYGALLVPSELPEADVGAIFVHNQGASAMCGHAVLCLARFVLDYGLRRGAPSPAAPSGEASVTIHCPCGPVAAFASWDGRRSGTRARFHSVPAFAAATDVSIDVPGYGKVVVDVGYGGAFYAFLSADQLGLDVSSSKIQDLVDAASAVTEAVKAQVDRSPTGSGVTARIALQYHKGLIQLNQTRTFRSSSTGSLFTGKAIKESKCGDHNAVIVEVAGESFYTGTSTFTFEEEDPLKYGFFLKFTRPCVQGCRQTIQFVSKMV
ncbi:trans-3-hydroxy-L-proline dehydratase isoform X3 [Anolis carolinensis]|uniref:trans-3-hydroxy-L-proline dehydratase isoform X3 n=1 Tax=Anolis carolinensis TaxID=28377 RepID=UPI002F2B67FE